MKMKVNLAPITKTEIKALKAGDVIYDSQGHRLKITSVKTWKTRPNDREINWKYGLFDFGPVYVRNGVPDMPLYKAKGERFRPAKGIKGLKVGSPVVAKIGLVWGDKRVSVGTRGIVTDIRYLTPEQSRLYHRGQKALLAVKWGKGGTFYNVYPNQVR